MKKSSLLLFFSIIAIMGIHAQGGVLKGKVLDAESKAPIAGVTVSPAGASPISTANDGSFSLPLHGRTILVVSHVGYKTQSVNVAGTETVIEIALQRTEAFMSEVVVIGYGKQQRKDITSAISSISGKDIKDVPVTNIASALQGRIPGMQVNTAGNQPGAGSNVLIRGINSITQGSGPLYVVDGVLINGNINEINPNDIESIDVLKDASAAAIYGSRASEGVVIITTKKAATGRSSLSYDAYYGVQKIQNGKGYDFIDNIDDYVKMRMAGYADEDPVAFSPDSASTWTKIFNPKELQSIKNREWYNWVDAVTQVAPMQSHTISYSNGVGKNKFYLSGNYLNQDGIIKGSNFLRYSVKANVESEATANLKIGANTNFSHTVNNIVSNEVYYNAVTMSPLWPIYDSTGHASVWKDMNSANITTSSPLELTRYPEQSVEDRNIMSFYGDWKVIKNLLFHTNLGVDILHQQKFAYYPRTTWQGYSVNGDAQVQNWGFRDYISDNTLTYDWKPANNHDFNFMGGLVYEKRRQEWDYVEATGFPDDDLTYKNLGAASVKKDIESNYFNRLNVSQMGRVIYKYKGKYILNASVRHDGSSRFGKNNVYGTFPAVSAAWRLSDEPFMGLKVKSIINDAKIRIGYGIVGNQNLPDDAKFPKMIPASYPYNGSSITSGYQMDANVLGNPDIRWEKQGQFNIGFDLALFPASRVTTAFDYYNKDIKDVLLQVPLAPSMGVGSQWINIAAMNTHGIDLGLKASVIQNKDVDWQIQLNWSKYTSKVTKLLPGRDSLNPTLKVGEAPNSLLVNYLFGGLYQYSDTASAVMKSQNARPGDVMLIDLNQDGIINQYDQTIVGRTTPKGYGGFWNYVRYKSFSATIYATYQYGHDVSNQAYQNYLYNTSFSNRIIKEGLNYWTPTNTNTVVPRPNAWGRSTRTMPSLSSSYVVQKGDFIRIRNITVAYEVNRNWLSKVKISSARIYVQAQEPLLLSKYKGIDPEIGVGSLDVYPRNSSYLVGFQIGL